VTMSTNLGWPSEPDPGPEHRRLGWLGRMLGVSRETVEHPVAESGADTEAPGAVADPALIHRSDLHRAEEGVGPSVTDEEFLAGGIDPNTVVGRPAAVDGHVAVRQDVAEAARSAEGRPVSGDLVSGAGDGTAPRTNATESSAARSSDASATEPGAEPGPVDRAVDDPTAGPSNEREMMPEWAGDNSVDDDLRRRRFDDGHADREAIVAALPPGDDETPLARELAENARRRIQLTGRPFPKPAAPRVLTVANQKGGVGKTTTAVNVAAALAQSGLTVLVIDLDPQGNASTALGIDHHAEVPSVYDVLVDGASLLEVVQQCTTVDNLFCAPATIDLAGAEIELVSLVARESRLQKAIAAATETGHSFDYILIDCPPSLGLLTVNAMVAASEVFIPIQCEYYALEGLSQLLRNIELVKAHLNPPLHVSTILLTMYDGRTRLSAQVADEVREHFPAEVLRTTVPRSVRVSEAPSFGETVMTYDPTSSGALAYLEAAGEIADRGASGQV
jgi:cellulose biosynthesis protein BcsQ